MEIRASVMKTWLKITVVVAAVAGSGLLLDRLLYGDGLPRMDLWLVSNLLTGAVAGALVYTTGRRHREREKAIEAKLKVINDMNHHVRNALQVITFYAATHHDEAEFKQIRDAIDRIQWALREVLPKLPGE
jgi:hypothetical protein